MSTVQHGKDLEIRGEPRYEITEENAESTSTHTYATGRLYAGSPPKFAELAVLLFVNLFSLS